MATLTKAVLGKVSGSLGDITFRQRNGRNFLSTRPSSYPVSTDINTINRRGRFAFASKLSAAINSIPHFKTRWHTEAANGESEYNVVLGVNYRFVTPDSITDTTQLLPGIGFRVKASATEISSNGVHVVLDPIGSNAGIDMNIEKTVQLSAIISLSNPSDDTAAKFAIIPISSAEQAVGLDGSLTFSQAWSDQESQIFQKYRICKAMFALITIGENGHPVHYSNAVRG
jgi:hypothetical protein